MENSWHGPGKEIDSAGFCDIENTFWKCRASRQGRQKPVRDCRSEGNWLSENERDYVCAAKSGETVAVSHLDQTKSVKVHFAETWDALQAHCGESGGACVNLATNEIHMVDDRSCMQHASHELAHVFGIPGLEAGESIKNRRVDFNRL